MHFGMVECKTTCGQCSSPMFINGPVTRILCNQCHSEQTIPEEVPKDILESLFEGWIEGAWEELEGRNSTVWGAINYELTVARQRPCCRECKTDFPEQDLAVRPGQTEWQIVCANCNKPMPVTLPPAFVKQKHPNVELIINAETATPDGKPEKPAIEGVVFACPKCGGGLEIDGIERMVPCNYCGAKVYLPDDLWLRLHPVKKVQRWYVGFTAFPDKYERKRVKRQKLKEVQTQLDQVKEQIKAVKSGKDPDTGAALEGPARDQKLGELKAKKEELKAQKKAIKHGSD